MGFAVTALLVGLMTERIKQPTFLKFFFASFAGLMVCYAIGVPYLYIILKYVNHANTTASGVLMKGFLLFFPWDIVKIAIASWLAKEVYGRINIERAQNA